MRFRTGTRKSNRPTQCVIRGQHAGAPERGGSQIAQVASKYYCWQSR